MKSAQTVPVRVGAATSGRWSALLGLLLLLAPRGAAGGGGPETTLVVVNGNSIVSRRVANEYVFQRDIPQSHVVYLERVPPRGTVKLDFFLERIWKPIRNHLEREGLEDQIDLVTYSADFPYGVDFRARVGTAKPDLAIGGYASLTGVTYFIRRVEAEAPFWQLDANRYYRIEMVSAGTAAAERSPQDLPFPARGLFRPRGARGFRSSHAWGRASQPVGADSLDRYVLATQLAYTGMRGNTVPEVLSYLRSAASADGTHPEGTVYLCGNLDVRSRTRELFFAAAARALEKLGRKVEILQPGPDGQDGIVPIGKRDVIGAVVGAAHFDWKRSGSRLLPGALGDHLTSAGGNFAETEQSKLSEFLRFGAAGASGTVTEPLALHQKFPNPLIHAYYAEGSSLAEAFYQSVAAPYQLAVVGDGLARPFASFADVRASAPETPWRGAVAIEPLSAAGNFELWVDGRRVATGTPLVFDTTQVEDGHHDVRIVAVSEDRIETRSYRRIDAVVANGRGTGRVSYRGARRLPLGQPIVLEAEGAEEIEVLQGSRVVAKCGAARCTVKSDEVGPGPVTLSPRARYPGGSTWRGKPLHFEVLPPPPIPSRPERPPYAAGLVGRAWLPGGEREIRVSHLGDRRSGVDLREQLDLEAASRLELTGELEARREGFFQLIVSGAGRVTMEVAGQTLCSHCALRGSLFLPVALGAGWHPLRIELVPQGLAHLEVLMGGDQLLAPPSLRHRAAPREGPMGRGKGTDDGGSADRPPPQSSAPSPSTAPPG